VAGKKPEKGLRSATKFKIGSQYLMSSRKTGKERNKFHLWLSITGTKPQRHGKNFHARRKPSKRTKAKSKLSKKGYNFSLIQKFRKWVGSGWGAEWTTYLFSVCLLVGGKEKKKGTKKGAGKNSPVCISVHPVKQAGQR